MSFHQVARRVSLATLMGLAALAAGTGAQAQVSAERGETLFRQRCASCHRITGAPTAMGPLLAGVFGRKAGATEYKYSKGMKEAGFVWDREKLDAFLAGPAKVVPGSRMMIMVPNPKDRADIIAFLEKAK